MPPPPDRAPFIVFGDGTFAEFHDEKEVYTDGEIGNLKTVWIIKPLPTMIAKHPIVKEMWNHNMEIKITLPKDAIISLSEGVGRRKYFVKTNPFGAESNATRHDVKEIEQKRFLEKKILDLYRENKQLRKQVRLLTEDRRKFTETMAAEFEITRAVTGPTYRNDSEEKNTPPPELFK